MRPSIQSLKAKQPSIEITMVPLVSTSVTPAMLIFVDRRSVLKLFDQLMARVKEGYGP